MNTVQRTFRILHTSDWHLDKRLFNQRRAPEHKRFLDWLRTTIREESVNALLVSGDIFDNRTPTLESQEMYIQFLTSLYQDCQRGDSVCRNIVIIGGNHDSALLLEIPKPILQYLNIRIVAKCPESWSDALLELKSADGQKVEALVAALPFLSEVDLRKAAPGDTAEEKSRNLMAGIRDAYRQLADWGVKRRQQLYEQYESSNPPSDLSADSSTPMIPLIATGHLFTQGAKTLDSDGVRGMYVGSLEEFSGGDFPTEFDYIALGHIHEPQLVNHQEHIRYSGSPISIGFDEVKEEKQVVLADWSAAGERTIHTRAIPAFQTMVQIKGDWEAIDSRLDQLVQSAPVQDGQSVWLEVVYTETRQRPSLSQDVEKRIAGTSIVLQGIKCSNFQAVALKPQFHGEALATLDPISVFKRVLNQKEIAPEDQPELLKTYREALELCDC